MGQSVGQSSVSWLVSRVQTQRGTITRWAASDSMEGVEILSLGENGQWNMLLNNLFGPRARDHPAIP